MTLAALLLASYLLGSVPTAYLVARWVKGIDIRTVGSGNIGATNAMRAVGPWAAVVVLLIDGLKGALPARWPNFAAPGASGSWSLACALAAVLGHNFPCFLGFRGGKGVATTLGGLIGAQPPVALAAIGTWFAVVIPTRYVSLGSIAAGVSIPLAQLALRRPLSEVGLGTMLAALILIRHGANLQRLRQGTEPRIGASARRRTRQED